MQPQSLKIREASVMEALSQTELLDEHWDELVKKKHIFQVNPDIETYQLLESQGKLFTLVAELDNKVVGYSVNIYSHNLHYKNVLMCSNDLLFVSKEYRNSSAGLKLIKETEKKAKLLDCKIMLWHSKLDTPLSKILPRLGNSLHENIFTKEL